MADLRRWRCPRCGFEDRQPRRVSSVSHYCAANRRKLTPLKVVKP